jgi:hypothetical protein
MTFTAPTCRPVISSCGPWLAFLAAGLLGVSGCASYSATSEAAYPTTAANSQALAARGSPNGAKLRILADAVRELAATTR